MNSPHTNPHSSRILSPTEFRKLFQQLLDVNERFAAFFVDHPEEAEQVLGDLIGDPTTNEKNREYLKKMRVGIPRHLKRRVS